MYWEWITLTGAGNEKASERSSVLSSLPAAPAKDVVTAVVQPIVATLGISQPPSPSPFETETEVDWCLQVVCHGLSLPFSDHEIIKDCVSIYCEWLSCLAPVPKISVPKPVTERPDFYARKMINQLYHLFIPRKGEAQDTINRQAILCHRVLRVLQNVIKTCETLEPETWECTLLFLIAINDAILSPPSTLELTDIGDQLCERVLSVLFEVWLLACGKSYPSPPLWKTLRESCQAWRHRANLFDQWNRINLILTGRVLCIMYGPEYVKLEDDGNLLPSTMTDDGVVQTWFRFLHTVGNPVELTQPTIISQTQNFLQYAIASEAVVDPCQHPCLSVLPSIFYQAMSGIAAIVDAFLGIPPQKKVENIVQETAESTSNPSPIPPVRRLAKSFSVATSTSSNVHKGLSRTSLLGITTGRSKDTSSIPSSSHSGSVQSLPPPSSGSSSHITQRISSILSPMAVGRPKINSILHLFGPWLFEAALICCEPPKFDGEVRRTSRGSAVPAALPESIDIPNAITIDKYYQGRAEALAILCRIFCSKKTGEDILPSYLARFYIAIQKGLKETRQEVLISILTNSPNLLRTDLDGVSVLTPSIVTALEQVLPSKDALRNDLRRSAIQLLLSLLSLPLHFLNVPIKEVLDKGNHTTSFFQLKPRLANLLINALQAETDSMNIQMLLGGLLMFVADTAAFEDVDKAQVNLGAESPTNLLSSENTSMRSFSDYSNSFDEHTLPECGDNSIDSAHALFVRATYLVCHRLISTWKIDLSVSLAALELLSGLARLKIQDQDPLECRRAVKWVCDFIIHQCSRPPPAHSKDLHSSIVSGFQCINQWLIAHPYLLEDKETLYTVLEVVEFGISGTKSQGKPGEPIKHKDEKELKPVSLRVRDAAEALLAVIFEQVGRYSPQNGVKTSSLVDECALLNQVHSQENLSNKEVIQHFRYFVIDHSILISMFEEPLGNDQDPQPTVTVILRGPTGRHAWNLQLRHLPRYKGKSFSSSGGNPGRPLPINDVGIRYDDIQHRYFPESADRIVYCKADKAIPPLDSLSRNSEFADQDSLEESRLSMILENQIRLEKSVANMIHEEADESYPNLRTEAQPPPVSQEFQTSRLLLSHLGFIAAMDGSDFSLPKLVGIDSRHPEFISELETLDSTSCRTFDTVHTFYVKAGQKTSDEILGNVQSRANIHSHFLEFLLSLGWPVNISQHAGWTGNVHTSWKSLNQHVSTSRQDPGGGVAASTMVKEDSVLLGKSRSSTTDSSSSNNPNENHGGSLYNGERWVLYYSDVTAEIAFVVPSGNSTTNWNAVGVWNVKESTSGGGGPPIHSKTDSSTLPDSEKSSGHADEGNRTKKGFSGGKACNDTKIFVVWLESYEDIEAFKSCCSDLMASTYTGLESGQLTEPSLIIFIHALKNGLFRIHLEGESLRMGLATPLIDGMVASRRVLGNLVRQTSLNMARRKRLESETFQPPHVRRKLKIQEIANKYTSMMAPQEFYTHFFENPTAENNKPQQQQNQSPKSSEPAFTGTIHHV